MHLPSLITKRDDDDDDDNEEKYTNTLYLTFSSRLTG